MPSQAPTTSNPLRILVVVHDFQLGGAERVALRLASRWAVEGQQVLIVGGSARGELGDLVDPSVSLALPARAIGRSRWSRISLAAFAATKARSFRPDLIFLPGNFYAGMAAPIRLRLGRRCPPIVTKLSNAIRRNDRGAIGQRAFEAALAMKTAFADRIVVMSPELRDEARRTLPWPAKRYAVIAQPVLEDGAGRQAHSISDGATPAIVAAGRLTPQKNFALLVEAASLLDPPFSLTIFGEGPERQTLERQITDLNLADRVRLAGFTRDMADALSKARLFVLSSDYEGFPSVLIEALAAGVPVVATNCSPAIASIVGEADAGELVAPGDAEGLAAAIRRSLAGPRPDPDRLAHSVDRYRLGPSAEAYLDLLRQLARRAD